MDKTDLEVRSSDQWFTVMDRMIKLAMDDIIDKTTVAEYCASRLVVFQHENKRRGLSMRMGRGEWSWLDVVSAMIGFMTQPSLAKFMELRLDRAYAQEILSEFLKATEGYVELVESAVNHPDARMAQRERIDSIHSAVGIKYGRDILQTVTNVTYLDKEITKFRNRILQVYSEYIERMANYDAAHHPLRVSAADTKQNYYLAAMKSVNHFNQERGSFKSYLDIWLKKARNTSSHVTGSAYTPPSGVKANHISVSMDKIEDTTDDPQAADAADSLLDMVAMVDPDGYLADALELDTFSY